MIFSSKRLRTLDAALDAIGQGLSAARGSDPELDRTLAALESPHVPAPAAGAQVIVAAFVCERALSELAPAHADVLAVDPDLRPLLRFVRSDAPKLREALAAALDDHLSVDELVLQYETILTRRHGDSRRRLGVFHTPTALASYVVERLDEALVELGLDDGLVDARTYTDLGLTPPPGVRADRPVVQIVDPAVGVGVFLREILRHAARRWAAADPATVADQVQHLLLPRLGGYEVLPATAVLCRLHLSVVLAQLGCDPAWAALVRLQRDNFLARVVRTPQDLAGTTVIVGNPPYARSSQNRERAMRELIAPYKRDLLDERNLQPLSDDYIKFMRATQLVLEPAPLGVMGLVTNHSYLRGRLHRSMRRSLHATFGQIDVLDLHGNAKVRHPGKRDENVFAIAQGVAVSTFVRRRESQGSESQEKRVRYAELRGRRSDKLARLASGRVPRLQPLTRQPVDSFAPVEQVPEEYGRFVPLPELFEFHSVGGKPGDDTVLVGFERDELLRKLRAHSAELLDGVEPRTEAARKLAQRPSDKPFAPESVIPYAYRPFDDRLAYYEPDIWTRPLRMLRQHVDGEPFLLTTRIVKDSRFAHVFTTRRFPDVIALSTTSSVNCYAFPSGQIRTEPFSHASGLVLSQAEAFAYVYATLHSPIYRARYVGGLRNDFPRVPICRDPGLLAALVARGGRLLRAHLREGRSTGRRPRFVDGGDRAVRETNVQTTAQSTRVSVNAVSRFEGLPAGCWDFRIGGYQVCRKWLSDRQRAQRELTDADVRHYCDMVARIDETLALQRDVDALVGDHGGWPNAFL